MPPALSTAALTCAAAFLGVGAVYTLVTFGLLFYERANRAGSSRRDGGPMRLPPTARERLLHVAAASRCVATEWLMTFPVFACSLAFAAVPGSVWRRVRWRGRGRPVVVVHGYSHNPAHVALLAARIHGATGRPVHLARLSPAYGRIEDMAAAFGAEVEAVAAAHREPRVDVVAHSMGGLVARHYIQAAGGGAAARPTQGGDPRVGRLVTIASPHAGTRVAVFGPGACARQLVPASRFLNALAGTEIDRASRICTSIWSEHDNIVVPATSAQLGDGACNRRLRYRGHTTLLVSRVVLRHVVAALGDRTAGVRPSGAALPPAAAAASRA